MMENSAKALGWGTIIAVMAGVGLVTGLLLGLMSEGLGLSPNTTTGGVGASVGIVGAILIMRRRAALEREAK